MTDSKTVPTFDGSLLSFNLPPVSEQVDDFIEDDAPAPAPDDAPADPHSAPDVDEFRGLLDDKGVQFDPALHLQPPEKTRTGRWKKIPKAQREAGETVEPNAAFRKQAQNFANLYGSLHVTVFGSDGQIDKQALAPLVDSLENYFIEEGLSELSPKAQVILGAFNYSSVICSRKPNAEKLKRWFAPVIDKVKNVFSRKKKQDDKKEPAPQSAPKAEPATKQEPTLKVDAGRMITEL